MLHGGRTKIAGLALAAFLSWGQAAAANGKLRGPYLTELSESGVVVQFELPAPAAASVEVQIESKAAAKGRTFESRASSAKHRVATTGLEPSTAYRYVVRSKGALIGEGRFVTAPKTGSDSPLTFLVYGDNRTDVAAHAAVVRAMEKAPSDFLVNTGDLVADGASDDDWQSFFDIESALLKSRPILAAIGNHEFFHDPTGTTFMHYFGIPDAAGQPRLYGSLAVGNVCFLMLDSMHPIVSGDQRAWLESELTRIDGDPKIAWRIVVVHEGPWSAGPHGASPMLLDGHIPELLAAHKVDLLFAGHDHTYQRGDAGAVKYIISGGGGAPLYDIVKNLPSTRKALSTYHFVEIRTTPTELRIVARRPDGTEVDRCGLHKGAGWDCDPPPPPAPPPASSPAPARGAPSSSPSSGSRNGCDVEGASHSGGSEPRALFSALGVLAACTWLRRGRRG